MKSFKLFALFSVALVFATSCKRETPGGDDNQNPGSNQPVDINKLVVPENFNLETFKDITVNVAVAGTSGERYTINIYDDFPTAGGKIASGFTNTSSQYSTEIRVPSVVKYLWIEKVDQYGNSTSERVAVNKLINQQFQKSGGANIILRKAFSGMDCNTGCTVTYNNQNGNVIVTSGQVACFTGTLSNADITIRDGGIIKICGSGTISGLTLEGSAKAYILENTILSVQNINTNSNNGTFKNYSDSLKFSSNATLNCIAENHGKMYVNNDFNINSDGNFKNYGTIKVNGNHQNSKKFYNYNKFTILGQLNNNGNAEFYNYCYLHVTQEINNSNYIYNNSYIKTLNKYNQTGNQKTELDNGAMISAASLQLDKEIKGIGANTSVVKVSGNTTINGSGKLTGTVNLCDANGVETNSGTISSPAAIACTGYIATSSCNTEGFGTPPVQDADGDSVPDGQDEYPNDPARAFNSYYPSSNSYASLAYEDLWPAKGDFDYNDLVVNYQVKKVLNADNKVVETFNKFAVRAVGASFDNGFGFQYDDVLASEVSDVTGYNLSKSYITLGSNKTEAGVTKAVIIAFDSPEPIIHRTSGSMFNTIKANPTGTSDTITVKVTFTSPVAESKVTQAKFNPFMIVNGQRGVEVHLGNFVNTSKANTALFGTQDDRTNTGTGKYYKTANNMPFAIEISQPFDYPVEKAAITSAYNYFDEWATSGGASNANWYQNQGGYREAANIY